MYSFWSVAISVVAALKNEIFLIFFYYTHFRQAVNEKAECVAKCTEEVCSSLVEDTLNADIAALVEGILDAELQRIHKYIKR